MRLSRGLLTVLRHRFYLAIAMAGMLMTNAVMANVTANWNHSNERNPAVIDHSEWQRLLSRYLITDDSSGVNLFDYRLVSQQDRELLQDYLQALQAIDPRDYRKVVQKAYWINLYNALTVELILEHYPVRTITKLGESLFAFGPWDDDIATVAGQTLTLNDIEHEILRPIWSDPRIHYAVNCASYSCPNLSATAFTSANTERLLEAGAQAYVNHPRGVRFNDGDLELSSIYDWYQKDFGDDEQQLLDHLIQYAEPSLKARLVRFQQQGGDLDYDYNWNLNEPQV